MLGCYDFCGHYEWTFQWLNELGGKPLVREYWDQAIRLDSQIHAAELIMKNGIPGMEEYWGHTLQHEGAGYHTTSTETVFRTDMHACPSKGFLIRNGLAQYEDYCDHCMGWIGQLMKEAGFTIDHEHNHCGQCWWEMRRIGDTSPPGSVGELSGANDVRLHANWKQPEPPDVYFRSNDADDKVGQ